jgi:hypothetical protein
LDDRDVLARGQSLRIEIDYECAPFTCPSSDQVRQVLSSSIPFSISAVEPGILIDPFRFALLGSPSRDTVVGELKALLLQRLYQYSDERTFSLSNIAIQQVATRVADRDNIVFDTRTTIGFAAIAIVVVVGFLAWKA